MLKLMVEEFFAHGRDAVVSSDPAYLHKFRITTKRLRYTIEVTKPKQRLEKLKVLQELLGNMNDAVIAEQYLHQLPSLSTKASRLPGKLKAKATGHVAEFRNYWKSDLDDEGMREEWVAWAAKFDSVKK